MIKMFISSLIFRYNLFKKFIIARFGDYFLKLPLRIVRFAFNNSEISNIKLYDIITIKMI